MALAEQFDNLEDKDAARRFLETAVARNPKLGPARERLAVLEMEAGDSGRAVELLEPVYAEVPDRYAVAAVLGEAYFRESNYEKTVEVLTKAIQLRRPTTKFLNYLALSHVELGDLESAKASLRRSLELSTDQPKMQELLDQLEAAPAPPPGG